MVYTNNKFTGAWPVGTAAVVVADNKQEATEILTAKLKNRGFKNPDIKPEQFKKVKTRTKGAIILQDGEY